MFFRNLKMKPDAGLDLTPVEVHLPVRMGHRDAVKVFGTPLGQQMAALGLGKVLSCAPRQRACGKTVGVDLQLGLIRPTKDTLRDIAGMLERLAAPLGSSMRVVAGTGTPLLFGRAEGLEVSVETDEAPDADTRRELASVCRTAIEDIAVNRGWLETEGRTCLIFYGEDTGAMKKNLAPVLAQHPRFAGARFERLA